MELFCHSTVKKFIQTHKPLHANNFTSPNGLIAKNKTIAFGKKSKLYEKSYLVTLLPKLNVAPWLCPTHSSGT